MAMSLKYSDIISQFDGSGDFDEWVQKLEMVASLQKVNNLENFLPLFLSGGAFKVYQSLSADDRKSFVKVRAALSLAFSLDQFTAYEHLMSRKLGFDESVDVYLSDITKLARLVEARGMGVTANEQYVKCAFVAGLPEDTKNQIRAACAMATMSLDDIATRTRMLHKLPTDVCMVSGLNLNKRKSQPKPFLCYACGKDGHMRRDCPEISSSTRSTSTLRKCFVCGSKEHMANVCPSRHDAQKN